MNIIKLLGYANILLVTFQLLSGLRVIRVPFKAHKVAGLILAVTAVLHATFAWLASQ